MSRIGRQPINIPEGVEVRIDGDSIVVKGPKGELTSRIIKNMDITIQDNTIKVKPRVQNLDTQKQFGLQRTLIANMVTGVSEGFKKELEVNGVGFRAQMKGKALEMSLGFSHPIIYTAPDGVELSVNQNIITVSGIDKQMVGEIAANIRSFKKPEPYKGKGIRYIDEHVRRKAGKAATKAGGE
jgi:large subunit ribosomal protein L6